MSGLSLPLEFRQNEVLRGGLKKSCVHFLLAQRSALSLFPFSWKGSASTQQTEPYLLTPNAINRVRLSFEHVSFGLVSQFVGILVIAVLRRNAAFGIQKIFWKTFAKGRNYIV